VVRTLNALNAAKAGQLVVGSPRTLHGQIRCLRASRRSQLREKLKVDLAPAKFCWRNGQRFIDPPLTVHVAFMSLNSD
jgi:hypothetical protein